MRFLLSVLVLSALVLAGCSGFRDSRVNPANWFGKSTSKNVVVTESGTRAEPAETNPLITGRADSQLVAANATSVQRSGIFGRKKRVVAYEGTLVDQVTDLRIERTDGGAIVHATALTVRQGAFDARLVRLPQTTDGGALTYELRALQPATTAQGAPRTRTISVAEFISHQDLEAVSAVRVVAARNVRTTRR